MHNGWEWARWIVSRWMRADQHVPINPRGGLTARQEYKKAAMQGLCANGGVLDRLAAAGQGDYPSNKSHALEAAENGLVTMAARFADAQLAEDAEHAKEKP